MRAYINGFLWSISIDICARIYYNLIRKKERQNRIRRVTLNKSPTAADKLGKSLIVRLNAFQTLPLSEEEAPKKGANEIRQTGELGGFPSTFQTISLLHQERSKLCISAVPTQASATDWTSFQSLEAMSRSQKQNISSIGKTRA